MTDELLGPLVLTRWRIGVINLSGRGHLRAAGGHVELAALDHVGINVADVDRSIRWYQEVLGLVRVHEEAWGDFPAVLEANGSGVALFPSGLAPVIPPARSVDDMSHIGFRTSRRGLEEARTEIQGRGIDLHEGDYGVAWSIYFDDPDGHQIEITTYEPPA